MKRLILAIIIVASGVMVRLWSGVYLHDEFAETHLFLKHRPTWKWKFYSPVGMSNLTIDDLTVAQREEQLYFNEFVSNRGMSK
jgi:hypothetical protein